MIAKSIEKQIIAIWDKYIADNKKVFDTKGKEYDDIDSRRIEAIETLKKIMQDFQAGTIDLAGFKTYIDSFNKQNNYWGFTATKGQMFFNLLLKTIKNDEQPQDLTTLMKQCVIKPQHLQDALGKIDALEEYVSTMFHNAPDKRRAPNPGSIGYFLSYFWQIHSYQEWPVMYSSMIESFTDIGLWQRRESQSDAYKTFYGLNEEIKQILSKHTGKSVSNWDAEHAFWHFRTVTVNSNKSSTPIQPQLSEPIDNIPTTVLDEASFDIYSYIPPIVENLIALGNETESIGSAKGAKYEKAVCEIFKQLGFTITLMGQGHRDPDLIAVHKEENVAFIVDAKAYANGYMLNAADDRAIREYISHHCPKLKKEGIQRIGFIIVSNSFKPGFEEFINDITWKTDIKRFVLLSSSALLHLLAYRIKDQKSLTEIVDAIISLGTVVSRKDVVQKFDDI